MKREFQTQGNKAKFAADYSKENAIKLIAVEHCNWSKKKGWKKVVSSIFIHGNEEKQV